MADSLFTKDVLIDVSVNIIPLAIIFLFVSIILVGMPWGLEQSAMIVVQFLPILIGVIGLMILTYIGALKIETTND